ncbi:MAG: nucleotidyltransferase domain-containing protein [Candidatus Delongbacteria bacterium]|nr:nucleotidyltransferase domain-containing protein [Candidatus Delongbacteria bacterium]MBN2835424.1 nucleotidyltransferase domain-containing protein [Candidatus Delongbacteria bacterium]
MTKPFAAILSSITSQIKAKHPDFTGVYFFGSRVKGYATDESDYDIAFIFDRLVDRKLKSEIISLVYDYEVQNDIIIDVLVYSKEDIENTTTPFRDNVKNEGIFYGV